MLARMLKSPSLAAGSSQITANAIIATACFAMCEAKIKLMIVLGIIEGSVSTDHDVAIATHAKSRVLCI